MKDLLKPSLGQLDGEPAVTDSMLVCVPGKLAITAT